MFQDGWICRACWNSNRDQDDKCYRCKTPRDQNLDVQPGERLEQSKPGFKQRDRLDTQMPVLAMLVSWPMLISGWLGMAGAVIVFVLALLMFVAGADMNAVLVGAIAFALGIYAAVWIFISRSVRRGARWAYAIGAIWYFVASVPWLLVVFGVIEIPPEVIGPEPFGTIQTAFSIVYGILGLFALTLFVASFFRQEADQPKPTTEAG